jgi:S-adenosylmethionine-dependent methyltransferase
MSDVVRRYYDQNVETEWERLDRPYRRFELVSTLRLIEEHFPEQGRVVDIGGGPGRYAVELVRLGYRVTLVDLSEKAIAFAREKLTELNLAAECLAVEDARDLSALPSEAFDAALMLGPMYHLVDQEDRRAALSELRRLLKPGAPAIVGFLNAWGILRAGLTEFRDLYENANDARALLDTCVQAGEQRAFTEAVFHTPPDALAELRAAGFAVATRAGVEGFTAGTHDEVNDIAETNPTAYENILNLVTETCGMPAFRDASEHLHVVIHRLGGRGRASANPANESGLA